MKRKKALVLEDDQLYRNLLTEILEEFDYEVCSFSDPTEAIEQWDHKEQTDGHNDYDLILTDNRMPGMSGLEFLNRIRQQNRPLPDHCTAVISASWSDSELQQAQELGCQIFHKPSHVYRIYAWLQQHDHPGRGGFVKR